MHAPLDASHLPNTVLPDLAEWPMDGHVVEGLFDALPVPLVVTSVARDSILAVNARASEMFGIQPADALGRSVIPFYADPADRQFLVDAVRATGRVDAIRLRLRRPDNIVIWVQASVRLIAWHGEPAVLSAFQDISDQVHAEESLSASERRLAAQSRALVKLTAASATGRSSDDRRPQLLRVVAETLQVERLSLWRFDPDCREIILLGLYRRSTHQFESGLRLGREAAPAYFHALSTERVIAASDALTDPRTREFAERYLIPNGIGAMLDVPLRQKGGTLGVLCAEHVGGSRAWTADEQHFAVSVANLVAMGVAEDERREALVQLAESEARASRARDAAERSRDDLDRELASAGRMQRLILPAMLPHAPGVDFVARYETSRHAGGDYYDVVAIGRHRFALIVADVSGHGASAAIVMAMIRAAFHTLPGPPDDPVAVLQQINRHFRFLWDSPMFATAVAGVLDVESRRLTLSSAGHPPPLLVRNGTVEPIVLDNAPLLLWTELDDVPSRSLALAPGDRVVFYTDGVLDRRGPGESRYSTERLQQTLAEGRTSRVSDLIDHLAGELDRFAAGSEPDDDQSILAFQVR